MALKYGKVSATDVFALLQNLAIAHPDSVEEYAKIYAHFIKKIKSSGSKDPFDWCRLAVSREKTRPNIMHVYVDGGQMVATDGRRVHVAPTNLPDGFYDAAGNRIEDAAYLGTFPAQWRQIIEVPADSESITLDLDAASLEIDGKHETLAWGDLILNRRYLTDAIGVAKSVTIRRRPGNPTKIFIDLGDERKAVVAAMLPAPKK